jgi:hypothetical protein
LGGNVGFRFPHAEAEVRIRRAVRGGNRHFEEDFCVGVTPLFDPRQREGERRGFVCRVGFDSVFERTDAALGCTSCCERFGKLDEGRGAGARRFGAHCTGLKVALEALGVALGTSIEQQRLPRMLVRGVFLHGPFELRTRGRVVFCGRKQLSDLHVQPCTHRRRGGHSSKPLAVPNRSGDVPIFFGEPCEVPEDRLVFGQCVQQAFVRGDGKRRVEQLRLDDVAEAQKARYAK